MTMKCQCGCTITGRWVTKVAIATFSSFFEFFTVRVYSGGSSGDSEIKKKKKELSQAERAVEAQSVMYSGPLCKICRKSVKL